MPLRQLYPDPNATSTAGNIARVDIIAVHGLNPRSKNDSDHAWDTWRTPSGPQGRLWLRDDLPQYISEARIFLYEYNSTAVYGKDRDTFVGKASELLEAIRIEREDIQSGPILFLGHSMGGLLIKQALINAHNNPKYTPIKAATTGLAFFATPHNGGDWMSVSLGGVVTKIATAVGFQKGDDVLETLKNGSIFSEIMQEQWKHQLLKYDIISFWGALDMLVPAKNARFDMPGDIESVVKLNADHSGVCKFGSNLRDRDNFKVVRSNIRYLYKEALRKNVAGSRTDVPNNQIPSYPLSSMAPVKTFVQRKSLLENIREQLYRHQDDDRRRDSKKVGVWGLGGAGKSQLALNYLQRYSADYEATFWVEAGQTASIDRDFLGIYQLLPRNAPLQSHQTAPDNIRQAVLNWFIGKIGKWLIIFDGADQLHKKDQNFVNLSQYIPGSPDVHVIITSRSSIARRFSTFEGVEVNELEEPQAIDLFLGCAEISSTKRINTEAQAIVNELGYLALAITIAGTYVSQTPRLASNLPAYLEEYRRRRRELLDEQPDYLIDNYSYSVMTVWETSYTAVYGQLPEACRVLTLLAFINYEDIFLDLFGLEPRIEPSWASIISTQSTITISLFEKCFAMLERYSLLKRNMEKSSYSMHRLVHAWDHDRLKQKNKSDIKHFCLAALQLLFEAVLKCKDVHQAKLRLLPHLKENFDTIRHLQLDTERESLYLMDVIECIGYFANDIKKWEEAAVMEREVRERRQEILGGEHPCTLSAMNNLAVTLRDQGKLDEAVVMQREVLERMQRILGGEHPIILIAMNNLAGMLRDHGKPAEALGMQREVLEKMKRIFGGEHPDTLIAINNLAGTLRYQGKLAEAVVIQREVLEKMKRILGGEHPDTLLAMNNLAGTLRDHGKPAEALVIQREVLEKRQRILSGEHPDTLLAMNNLANTLRYQGKLAEAVVIQREVLEKMKRIFGDEHPDTFMAMNNLANTLRYQGKPAEAVVMQREVLEKMQRILGGEHPDTLIAMNNLANTFGEQGKLDEAVVMQREVLEKMKRILGGEHPDTLLAMDTLTILLGEQSKLDEAVVMQREVLEKMKRILGGEHPDTLLAMDTLTILLGEQSKLDKAAESRPEKQDKQR